MTDRIKERDLDSLKQFLATKAERGEKVNAAVVYSIVNQLIEELMTSRKELSACRLEQRQETHSLV